jgi:hypothetical protein
LYVVSDPVVPWSVKVVSAIARRDLVREYALAHEIVHFLQHESHPALFTAIMRVKDSDDAVWAAQAAIEGDAVRYGFEATRPERLLGNPPPADFQAQLEKAVATGSFATEPRFIRDGMSFSLRLRLSPVHASRRDALLESPPWFDRASTASRQAPRAVHDLRTARRRTPGCARAVGQQRRRAGHLHAAARARPRRRRTRVERMGRRPLRDVRLPRGAARSRGSRRGTASTTHSNSPTRIALSRRR